MSLAPRRSLRRRLVVFGAILPTALFALAVLVTGAIFSRLERAGIDDAMRTQAAVEAVSLFDSPDGLPHVHLGRSPLGDEVDGVASAVALYGEGGERLAEHPVGHPSFPARLAPEHARDEGPRDARDPRGSPIRVLTRVVRDPDGRRVTLWLGHDLGHHEATIRAYYESAALVVGLVALALLVLQLTLAARLHRRLATLVEHMERLREGDLDAELPPDPSEDELGALRATIADATLKLRAARRTQERLVSDAAHELRTPLATMKAAIGVTLRRERSAAELREALENVHEEVDRLASLSSALLDLAALRAQAQERADVDLSALVDKAATSARGAAELKGVTIEVTRPSRLALRGSARELRQAVDNLLANAIAHTPKGSRVRVALEPRGASARLVVRDEGPGIPETERELVFEPFHRSPAADASSNLRGKGLGLAIVRDVATRHGGRAWILDEPGGAAVAVELEVRDPSEHETSRP